MFIEKKAFLDTTSNLWKWQSYMKIFQLKNLFIFDTTFKFQNIYLK